jgi:hypothetical protein
MPKLDELPMLFPDLFKDKDFHFECGDGWYRLLSSLLGLINRELSRHQEVISIKDGVISRGEEPLPWIAKYLEKNPVNPLEKFSVQQIKEKFGGLRFYVSFGGLRSDAIQRCEGAISLAEQLSYNICEVCGNVGGCSSPMQSKRIKDYKKSVGEGVMFCGGGYMQTLCEEHHKEKIDDIIKRHKEYKERKDGQK